MNPQALIDGLVAGSMIGLGAIGVTLTYAILRFANFAHGEFVTSGAYLTLVIMGALGAILGGGASLAPFSVTVGLMLALVVALAATGLLAIALDLALFSPLRRRGATVIITVIASFGASLALRSLIEFVFTARPQYFTRELQIAMPLVGGVRATPDQLGSLALTAFLVLGTHLILTRTDVGRAMRAVAKRWARNGAPRSPLLCSARCWRCGRGAFSGSAPDGRGRPRLPRLFHDGRPHLRHHVPRP